MIKLKNKKDFKKLKPNDYLLLVSNKEIKRIVKIDKVLGKYFYQVDYDFGFSIEQNLRYAKEKGEFYYAKATKKDMPSIIAFYLTC